MRQVILYPGEITTGGGMSESSSAVSAREKQRRHIQNIREPSRVLSSRCKKMDLPFLRSFSMPFSSAV